MRNINNGIEDVIQNKDLRIISKDFTEVAIDGILEDGVLKNIPIVNTLVNLVNFGNTVNKSLFTKKIYQFLFELRNIPQDKRNKQINKINNSMEYQNRVGETVIEILEKIESDGKPQIIGKLFKGVIEEEIDYHTFLKLSHIVKNLFYFDIVELKEKYDGEYIEGRVDKSLQLNGIVQNNISLLATYEDAKNGKETVPNKDTLTSLGKILIEIGMKDN